MFKNTDDEYYLYLTRGNRQKYYVGQNNIGLYSTNFGSWKLYKFVEGQSLWSLISSRDDVSSVSTISSEPISDLTFVWTWQDKDIYASDQTQVLMTLLAADNAYSPSTGEVDETKLPPGSNTGGNGYNDSSFKSLVTDLFDHLFDILLYGEDEDYDGTDVDDSIEWLDDLSEDMEDVTDKLNQAPTYISNGFTAISNAQAGINDFFSGISTAVPVLYYGIVGILNILIIRKIIGR